ncbi:Rieske (2Fe-2S) protein [Gynuella sp.]|uniref:Rieske (2Fe-2S) protein n=1 Tax=Gynuella sp. TaxID=2969146 RepID=UPI003D096358
MTQTFTLGPEHEIEEGHSKGYELPHLQVFAVRRDGLLYVYKNDCPHLNINLEWQEDQFLDMDAAFIQCSGHGALFEIETGICISGPCQGEHLTVIAHEIDAQGQIVINVAEEILDN